VTESIALRATRPAGVDVQTHHDVTTWLYWEAELLDQRRFREWLSLLADEVRYRMPVTVTTMRRTDHVSLGGMAHFDEDRYSLEKRVERLEGDHAWTEDPP
jgi:3-phenylpropionate/cinnamic acid dioxygenase small subunit